MGNTNTKGNSRQEVFAGLEELCKKYNLPLKEDWGSFAGQLEVCKWQFIVGSGFSEAVDSQYIDQEELVRMIKVVDASQELKVNGVGFMNPMLRNFLSLSLHRMLYYSLGMDSVSEYDKERGYSELITDVSNPVKIEYKSKCGDKWDFNEKFSSEEIEGLIVFFASIKNRERMMKGKEGKGIPILGEIIYHAWLWSPEAVKSMPKTDRLNFLGDALNLVKAIDHPDWIRVSDDMKLYEKKGFNLGAQRKERVDMIERWVRSAKRVYKANVGCYDACANCLTKEDCCVEEKLLGYDSVIK